MLIPVRTDASVRGQVPCPLCRAQEEKRDLVFTMERGHPHNSAGKPIATTLKVVRDDEGRAMSLFITLHDLTHERKIQEEYYRIPRASRRAGEEQDYGDREKEGRVERMNKLFVGRELRMIELKKRMQVLEEDS